MRLKQFFLGIKFKTWLNFVLFSLLIVGLLIVFQVFLFEPYYRQMKMNDIRSVVSLLAENKDNTRELNEITVSNDGCALLIQADGSVQVTDAIGVNCLLYQESKVNTDYVDDLKNSETNDLSLLVEVSDTQEMLVYGNTFLDDNDRKFYVLFNTSIHPVQSTLRIIRSQYFVITLVVILLSLIISLFFSDKLTKPIVSMQKEAVKLSEGNYKDVRFDANTGFKELNELSDTLNTTSSELAKLDDLRTDLIANVSHDIRTPITMIQAYAEMIRDITGEDKEKREANLEIILSEVDYMNKLVNDMSEMTKMQSGQVKLQISDFDLAEVIESTVEKFSTISASEGLDIIQYIEPELIAHADKFRITEVIYNFVGNAIKHYGEDKQIIIKAYEKGKNLIRVEVTDHGPGIDPELLSHIWERYYKTDKKYQRAQKGSGLGLAISKAILDKHNAEYGVISKLNEGSTFYFEIEAADNQNL